eukprot:CFRG6761T1
MSGRSSQFADEDGTVSVPVGAMRVPVSSVSLGGPSSSNLSQSMDKLQSENSTVYALDSLASLSPIDEAALKCSLRTLLTPTVGILHQHHRDSTQEYDIAFDLENGLLPLVDLYTCLLDRSYTLHSPRVHRAKLLHRFVDHLKEFLSKTTEEVSEICPRVCFPVKLQNEMKIQISNHTDISAQMHSKLAAEEDESPMEAKSREEDNDVDVIENSNSTKKGGNDEDTNEKSSRPPSPVQHNAPPLVVDYTIIQPLRDYIKKLLNDLADVNYSRLVLETSTPSQLCELLILKFFNSVYGVSSTSNPPRATEALESNEITADRVANSDGLSEDELNKYSQPMDSVHTPNSPRSEAAQDTRTPSPIQKLSAHEKNQVVLSFRQLMLQALLCGCEATSSEMRWGFGNDVHAGGCKVRETSTFSEEVCFNQKFPKLASMDATSPTSKHCMNQNTVQHSLSGCPRYMRDDFEKLGDGLAVRFSVPMLVERLSKAFGTTPSDTSRLLRREQVKFESKACLNYELCRRMKWIQSNPRYTEKDFENPDDYNMWQTHLRERFLCVLAENSDTHARNDTSTTTDTYTPPPAPVSVPLGANSRIISPSDPTTVLEKSKSMPSGDAMLGVLDGNKIEAFTGTLHVTIVNAGRGPCSIGYENDSDSDSEGERDDEGVVYGYDSPQPASNAKHDRYPVTTGNVRVRRLDPRDLPNLIHDTRRSSQAISLSVPYPTERVVVELWGVRNPSSDAFTASLFNPWQHNDVVSGDPSSKHRLSSASIRTSNHGSSQSTNRSKWTNDNASVAGSGFGSDTQFTALDHESSYLGEVILPVGALAHSHSCGVMSGIFPVTPSAASTPRTNPNTPAYNNQPNLISRSATSIHKQVDSLCTLKQQQHLKNQNQNQRPPTTQSQTDVGAHTPRYTNTKSEPACTHSFSDHDTLVRRSRSIQSTEGVEFGQKDTNAYSHTHPNERVQTQCTCEATLNTLDDPWLQLSVVYNRTHTVGYSPPVTPDSHTQVHTDTPLNDYERVNMNTVCDVEDSHDTFVALARRLILAELTEYRNAREEECAWRNYKKKERELAEEQLSDDDSHDQSHNCPIRLMGGAEDSTTGIYPGPLSLTSLCLLKEFEVRYGIDPPLARLTIVDIVGRCVISRDADLSVFQALAWDYIICDTATGATNSISDRENECVYANSSACTHVTAIGRAPICDRQTFVQMLERVLNHQIHDLTKYKIHFGPNARIGALQKVIVYIHFLFSDTNSEQIHNRNPVREYTAGFSNRYPPVEELLKRCISDGTQATYSRFVTQNTEEGPSLIKKGNCVGKTDSEPRSKERVKNPSRRKPSNARIVEDNITAVSEPVVARVRGVTSLLVQTMNEIELERKVYSPQWTMLKLLDVTVPLYLSRIVRSLTELFKDITEVVVADEMFDLYFTIRSLKSRYKEFWEQMDGDRLYLMVDWFGPVVFGWLDALEVSSKRVVDATLADDRLVHARTEKKGSLKHIFHAKYAHVLGKTVEYYQGQLLEKMTNIQTGAVISVKTGGPTEAMRQLCTGLSNIQHLHNHLIDMCMALNMTTDQIIHAQNFGLCHRRHTSDDDEEGKKFMSLLGETFTSIRKGVRMAVNLLSDTLANSLVHRIRMATTGMYTTCAERDAMHAPLFSPITKKKKQGLWQRFKSTGLSSPPSSTMNLHTSKHNLSSSLTFSPTTINRNISVVHETKDKVDPMLIGARLCGDLTITIRSLVAVVSSVVEPKDVLMDVVNGAWKEFLLSTTRLIIPKNGPLADLPNEDVISILSICLEPVKEVFGQCARGDNFILQETDACVFLERCLRDYTCRSSDLVQRYNAVMSKPLRENEDVTDFITNQETVQHIIGLLSQRTHDTVAEKFTQSISLMGVTSGTFM